MWKNIRIMRYINIMWFILNTCYCVDDNIRNMRKISKYQGILKSSHLYQDYGVGERPLFFLLFFATNYNDIAPYSVLFFALKKRTSSIAGSSCLIYILLS